MRYRFTATLWKVPNGAWHFVTLPHDVTDEIDDSAPSARVGFGSVRVDVTIGATSWQTSVFPDTTARSFVLPVKRPVRSAEGLDEGDEVTVELGVRDSESGEPT